MNVKPYEGLWMIYPGVIAGKVVEQRENALLVENWSISWGGGPLEAAEWYGCLFEGDVVVVDLPLEQGAGIRTFRDKEAWFSAYRSIAINRG